MQIEEPFGNPEYGTGDASYRAAGEEEGIRHLVDDFYDAMDSLPEVSVIRSMHPENLEVARDKLARFLCGWLGGPRLYAEKYGAIHIPKAHAHLPIGASERDQWMLCMRHALSRQDYPDAFKTYLLTQLLVPAERCRNQE